MEGSQRPTVGLIWEGSPLHFGSIRPKIPGLYRLGGGGGGISLMVRRKLFEAAPLQFQTRIFIKQRK